MSDFATIRMEYVLRKFSALASNDQRRRTAAAAEKLADELEKSDEIAFLAVPYFSNGLITCLREHGSTNYLDADFWLQRRALISGLRGIASRTPRPQAEANTSLRARHLAIQAIADAYREQTGRAPTFKTIDGDALGGPFVEFLMEAAETVGLNAIGSGLAQAAKRMHQKGTL